MTEFALVTAYDGYTIIQKVDSDGVVTEKFKGLHEWIYSIASTSDLQTICVVVRSDATDAKPRIYTSTDYGENFSKVTSASLNSEMIYPTAYHQLVYDGTYFWVFFSGSSGAKAFKSADGVSWASAGTISGSVTTSILLSMSRCFYDSGYYYLVSSQTVAGVRLTYIHASTDGLAWTLLDDTSFGNSVDQNNYDVVFQDVGGTLCIVNDGSWGYTHGQTDYTLTRTVEWASSYPNKGSVFASWSYKNKLYIYGELDTNEAGVYVSADKGATFTQVYDDYPSYSIYPGNQMFGNYETYSVGTTLNSLLLGHDKHLYAASNTTLWVDVVNLSSGYDTSYNPSHIIATPNFAISSTIYTAWENIVNLEEI